MTNVTWLNNVTGPESLIDGVVNATNGGFYIGLMISIFFIVMITLAANKKEFYETLIYTGALEFLLAVFGLAKAYIGFQWLLFPIALLFAGLMIRFFAQD